MADSDPIISEARARFMAELVSAGHLIPLGVPGLLGRSGTFEGVIEHFEGYVSRRGADQNAEVMRFPPILSRATYEGTDHVETMPQLLGSVHSFDGDERVSEWRTAAQGVAPAAAAAPVVAAFSALSAPAPLSVAGPGDRVRVPVLEDGIYSLSAGDLAGCLSDYDASQVQALIGQTNLSLSMGGEEVAWLPMAGNAGVIFFGEAFRDQAAIRVDDDWAVAHVAGRTRELWKILADHRLASGEVHAGRACSHHAKKLETLLRIEDAIVGQVRVLPPSVVITVGAAEVARPQRCPDEVKWQ